MPFSKEDKLAIARRLRYQYFPKGTPVRNALDKQYRWMHILRGKVSCAMPTEEEANRRAKKMGLHMDLTAMSIAQKRQVLNKKNYDNMMKEELESKASREREGSGNLLAVIPEQNEHGPMKHAASHVNHIKAIHSARKLE